MTPEEAVSHIRYLYDTHGHHNYDEAMSQVQHAVQSGRLAMAEGHSDAVVLGAFLHDIGHLMVNEVPEEQRDDAVHRHQVVGANLLRKLGFSDLVVDIVEKHVDGKRYLTGIDPEYANRLSPASINSLRFQGGPMSEGEIAMFDRLPDKQLHIRMRHWDDAAKNPDDTDLDIEPFMEMAKLHLQKQLFTRQSA